MRRFLRFTSSILASTSLALGVIAASVAISGTAQADGPTYCGPPFVNNNFQPPRWDCANWQLCVPIQRNCSLLQAVVNGQLVYFCQCT